MNNLAQHSPLYEVKAVDGREIIVLAPDRSPFKVAGLLTLLLGFAAACAAIPWHEEDVTIVVAAGLLVWTSVALMTVYEVARIGWERQTIVVDGGKLEIVSTLGGWRRRKRYEVAVVRDLRALPDALGSEAARGIEFSYEGRKFVIGAHLYASDCAAIVELLAKSLPPSALPKEYWNPLWQQPNPPRLLDDGAG